MKMWANIMTGTLRHISEEQVQWLLISPHLPKIRHEYIPNSSENLEGRGGGHPIFKHKIKHVL